MSSRRRNPASASNSTKRSAKRTRIPAKTCIFRWRRTRCFRDLRSGDRTKMTRLDRTASLPEEMQGRWVEVDNGSMLIVDGGEITCFGQVVEYDYKEISEIDGALTV